MGRDTGTIRIAAAMLCAMALLATCPARADDLLPAFIAALPPGATETTRVTDRAGFHGVPVGPAGPATPPPEQMKFGLRERIAWSLPGDDADGVQNAVTGALATAGFDTLYTCQTDACGGFDFRLALPVLPLPDMAVNLAGFRFVAARRATPAALAGVLISANSGRIHVQLTLVTPQTETTSISREPPETPADTSAEAPVDDRPRPQGDIDLAAQLDDVGRAVLDGLDFAPGGTTLVSGDSPALAELAAWLAADRARRVALVGHTDWTGTTEANIAVSRARADAVRAALQALGADPVQITVAGAGPFAPRSANTTPEGLAANRRVEAVRLPSSP